MIQLKLANMVNLNKLAPILKVQHKQDKFIMNFVVEGRFWSPFNTSLFMLVSSTFESGLCDWPSKGQQSNIHDTLKLAMFMQADIIQF